eukprot:scaffold279_cov90-Cylindrotheca_fusiformis.AAC.2
MQAKNPRQEEYCRARLCWIDDNVHRLFSLAYWSVADTSTNSKYYTVILGCLGNLSPSLGCCIDTAKRGSIALENHDMTGGDDEDIMVDKAVQA